MLKSNYKNNIITNSIIDLGDDLAIEGKGKGKKFISKFIEPGVAHYDEFGDVLITKETLDKFINTMVGCPVIIKHKDLTDKNADDERVGVISNVWFNELDGWYYCDGIIWDKQAIDLIKNQNWSVSCTYDFESDREPKTHNGKNIDMEFTNGEFLHLALVDNPRYERANIVMNSKDEEQTTGEKPKVKNSLTSIFSEAMAEVVTNCLGELRANNKNDEPKDWITIKGNHIPVFDNKKDTAKKFIEEKQEKENSEHQEENKNVLEASANYAKSLSKKQQEAIIAYTNDDRYTKINAYLRDERGNIDTKTEQTLKALDKALNSAELLSDLTVYRGVRADFIEKALKDTAFKDRFEQTFFKTPKDFELENIKNHFIGQEFTEKGFMSTSYDKSKAFQDTEIMLTVNLKKGIKAMNIAPLSVHDEAEILVNHGYKFTISDVQIDKNPYGRSRWNFILDTLPV